MLEQVHLTGLVSSDIYTDCKHRSDSRTTKSSKYYPSRSTCHERVNKRQVVTHGITHTTSTLHYMFYFVSSKLLRLSHDHTTKQSLLKARYIPCRIWLPSASAPKVCTSKLSLERVTGVIHNRARRPLGGRCKSRGCTGDGTVFLDW